MAMFPVDPTQKPQKLPLIIDKGSFNGKKIKSGTIVLNNTDCSYSMDKENNLTIPDLKTTSMKGHVSGKVTYNLFTSYMTAKINTNGINAAEFSESVLLMPGMIQGTLNSDIDISTKGTTPTAQTKNAKGIITFNIKNGQMGSLGSFGHFLNAANLVASNFISLNVNEIINTLKPKNTGQFDTLNGSIKLNKGIANIEKITSQGKHLSLYISGETNMLDNTGILTILGRTSSDVVKALGPLGELSIDKLLTKIPRFGNFAQNLLNTYYIRVNKNQISQIPPLTSDKNSKIFKVSIKGNLQSPRAVKSFQWINE